VDEYKKQAQLYNQKQTDDQKIPELFQTTISTFCV
jgi:hypothetical protein